jgi:hypothetical protein
MPQSGDVLAETKVLKIHFGGKRIDVAPYKRKNPRTAMWRLFQTCQKAFF